LIGDILADPDARMLEFGRGLQFPVQTAIKTAPRPTTATPGRLPSTISTPWRVWMGNLDGAAMDGVTGAVGPAHGPAIRILRAQPRPGYAALALSRDLVLASICRQDGLLADEVCESTNEWFLSGTVPPPRTGAPVEPAPTQYRMLQPTAGLRVAHDRGFKRIRGASLQIAPVPGLHRVDWYVDGKLTSTTNRPSYPWPLQGGAHTVHARVWMQTSSDVHDTEEVRFYVN